MNAYRVVYVCVRIRVHRHRIEALESQIWNAFSCYSVLCHLHTIAILIVYGLELGSLALFC